jgi:hypothetical protein
LVVERTVWDLGRGPLSLQKENPENALKTVQKLGNGNFILRGGFALKYMILLT